MATVLSDSPPASPDGPAATGPGDGAPTPPGGAPAQPPAGGACPSCRSPMADGQDWCLQCGAGAPGGVGTPSWRSAATILGASAVIVLGAAGAGYAALNKHTAKTPAASTIAQTSTPAAITPPPATTPATSVPVIPTTPKVKLPKTLVKPPKIPLTANVPATTKSGAKAKLTPTGASTGGAGTGSGSKPKAILLDTDAASTYNPYNYSPGLFGDPSLTIDGDTSTGWTAQVEAAVAPKLAEGVLISLKSKQTLSLVKLVTSTPGMTVQVLGSNGRTPPNSITDPAWTTLSGARLVKKQHIEIKLRHSNKAFTFVTLWISKAPAGSTSEDPGHVSVNELELFPASE